MTKEQIKGYIQALEEGLADNVLTIEFEGKKTTFDNAQGIIRRIKYFKEQLSVTAAGSPRGPRRTTVYTTGRKGL
nr:hypothetical protein CKG001_10110 [Bdellovibrio sp. CKG001]